VDTLLPISPERDYLLHPIYQKIKNLNTNFVLGPFLLQCEEDE